MKELDRTQLDAVSGAGDGEDLGKMVGQSLGSKFGKWGEIAGNYIGGKIGNHLENGKPLPAEMRPSGIPIVNGTYDPTLNPMNSGICTPGAKTGFCKH